MNISQDTKLIPLTQGKFVIVDADDYEWLNQWKWFARAGGGGGNWYAFGCFLGKGRVGKMHSLIMQPPEGMLVDHIDGNGLNNSRSNLRVCTKLNNCRNRKQASHNSSGFKCVEKISRTTWRATITIDTGRIHLGCYDSPEKAARVYDEAAIKYFGEFARTNEMLGLYEKAKATINKAGE